MPISKFYLQGFLPEMQHRILTSTYGLGQVSNTKLGICVPKANHKKLENLKKDTRHDRRSKAQVQSVILYENQLNIWEITDEDAQSKLR